MNESRTYFLPIAVILGFIFIVLTLLLYVQSTPTERQEIIQFLAALSGPIGGSTALWVAYKGGEEAQERQQKSFTEARNLQQKRFEKEKAEKSKRAATTKVGLINELMVIYIQTVSLKRWCEQQLKETDPRKRAWDNQFVSSRPVFENSGPILPDMSEVIYEAICGHEAMWLTSVKAIDSCFLGPNKVDYTTLMKRLQMASQVSINYMRALSKDENSGEMPTEDEMVKAAIKFDNQMPAINVL